MDGLVSNTALVAGVAGGGASSDTVLLAGLAGLAAGAFSMATGEYVSVASQTELTRAEIEIEKREIARVPDGRAGRARRRSTARAASTRRPPPRSPASSRATPSRSGACTPARSSASTPTTCPRRGPRPARRSPPSPSARWCRCCRTSSAPTRCSSPSCSPCVALFVAGALVSRFTDRGALYSGGRQLLLGGAAAALTYAVGSLVGTGIS